MNSHLTFPSTIAFLPFEGRVLCWSKNYLTEKDCSLFSPLAKLKDYVSPDSLMEWSPDLFFLPLLRTPVVQHSSDPAPSALAALAAY